MNVPTPNTAEIVTKLAAEVTRLSGKIDDLGAIICERQLNGSPSTLPSLDGLPFAVQKMQDEDNPDVLRAYMVLWGEMVQHMISTVPYAPPSWPYMPAPLSNPQPPHPDDYDVARGILAVIEAAFILEMLENAPDENLYSPMIYADSVCVTFFPNPQHRTIVTDVIEKCRHLCIHTSQDLWSANPMKPRKLSDILTDKQD